MRSFIVLAGLLASACASSPGIVDTGRVKVADAASLPIPTDTKHVIGPFDELAVKVYGIEELGIERVRVDADGNIVLPLIGAVEAGGKTSTELMEVVQARLRQNGVRDPRVTIVQTETVSRTISVDGEVRQPGIYPIVGRMSLLRAVARAQGTTQDAETKNVVVFRKVDGQQWAALYNLRAIRTAAYEDPELYPNDVVVVGDSATRRLLPTIVQAAGALLNPIVLLVR